MKDASDHLDIEFATMLSEMTPQQKKFLVECLQEHESGRCTFDEALAKIKAGWPIDSAAQITRA